MILLNKLISVKKIIAILLTVVFCVLSLTKQIGSTEFLSVFSMVVGYYFGASVSRQATNEAKELI